MLFWSFVILIVIGVVLLIVGSAIDSDGLTGFGAFTLVAGLTCTLISLIILGCTHLTKKANIAEYNARYESLVYQYENDVYENDNDLGKRELYVDIERWNSDLAYKKEAQRNIWVGIFYPDIYDQFEFISLDKED